MSAYGGYCENNRKGALPLLETEYRCRLNCSRPAIPPYLGTEGPITLNLQRNAMA
jgi:hypothetical protein